MAILNGGFIGYLSKTLTSAMEGREPAFACDELYAVIEACRGDAEDFSGSTFFGRNAETTVAEYRDGGVAGVVAGYFKRGVIDQFAESETERRVVALKTGFPGLPATTCSLILRGFGEALTERQVSRVYASHGLATGMRELAREYDFAEINRRAKELEKVLTDSAKRTEYVKRFDAMYRYLHASPGKQELAIRESGVKRSLFFHYLKRFRKYGMIGLADSGGELFRRGKVGLENEVRIVVGKLQKPHRQNIDFVRILESKGVKVRPSAVSIIFKRWRVDAFRSKFVDNLKRLENEFRTEEEDDHEPLRETKPIRLVDSFYPSILRGLAECGMATASPGLFILWIYLERLGVFPVLDGMGLASLPAGRKKGYSWLELLLLNIGRIFYGVDNYSAVCEHPDQSLPFFAGLVKAPCNDTFLNVLESGITEKQTFKLRQWLIAKARDIGVVKLRKTALDFHQIDMDVIFDRIRGFGKGPSPKKKICYNGFRPHIAWDVETGCLIAAEFRKSSARGTTTAIPFIKDYLLSAFDDCFETVYIDSEYTGKSVWQFILDKEGMNASLTACLKQNAFVKKARDAFLRKHENEEGFWQFYDDDHVHSSKTFDLKWKIDGKDRTRSFKLKCVVKKNVNNGTLRCFGSSKEQFDSKRILSDYSNRWIIENGIKDLIASYFMDKCPGTRPHLADVHFLTVSICRILFKMISDDLGDDGRNPDGTTKTLARMRARLFRQGAGKVFFRNDTFEIKFDSSFSLPMTQMLKRIFDINKEVRSTGLDILGGKKLQFAMRVPYGEEHSNGLEKVPISVAENL